jgi:hypothetical protein
MQNDVHKRPLSSGEYRLAHSKIRGTAEVRINDLPRIGALCAASLAGLVAVFVVLQALSLTLANDQRIIENIAKSIERGQITEADALMTPYGRFVELWSDCNAISVNLGNINDSMGIASGPHRPSSGGEKTSARHAVGWSLTFAPERSSFSLITGIGTAHRYICVRFFPSPPSQMFACSMRCY